MHDFLTINHIVLILVTVDVFLEGVFLGRLIQKLKDLSLLKKQRKDAVKKSRAVIGGQVAEQLAPYLPEFPCNPGDVCFLGKPVDFIGFTGLTESDELHEVMFIEVKTGQSKLNGHEKQLKDAIQKGRVRYVEYNPSL